MYSNDDTMEIINQENNTQTKKSKNYKYYKKSSIYIKPFDIPACFATRLIEAVS